MEIWGITTFLIMLEEFIIALVGECNSNNRGIINNAIL